MAIPDSDYRVIYDPRSTLIEGIVATIAVGGRRWDSPGDTAMRWFSRRGQPRAEIPPDIQVDLTGDGGDVVELAFVCADCGRTDLPPAGDWDPPICQECDAAINFDAIEEGATVDEL